MLNLGGVTEEKGPENEARSGIQGKRGPSQGRILKAEESAHLPRGILPRRV